MNTGKQINAMIVLLLLLLLAVGVYTIWDPFRAEAEKERTLEDMAERAARTYAANCRQCHGNMGEGRIAPALNPEFRQRSPDLVDFTDPDKIAENRILVRNTINCGRIGTIMPAWSQEQGGALTDEQIRRLVILITEPPKDAWKHAEEFAEEQEHEGNVMPPVEEVLASASITGANQSICGQKPAPTQPADIGPVEIRDTWTVVATDNRFDLRAMGVPANQQVTVTLQNRGAAIHNWAVQGVKASDGRDISTQLIPGGQSDTVRFTIATPGTYRFLCTVHPVEMVGGLKVE